MLEGYVGAMVHPVCLTVRRHGNSSSVKRDHLLPFLSFPFLRLQWWDGLGPQGRRQLLRVEKYQPKNYRSLDGLVSPWLLASYL